MSAEHELPYRTVLYNSLFVSAILLTLFFYDILNVLRKMHVLLHPASGLVEKLKRDKKLI